MSKLDKNNGVSWTLSTLQQYVYSITAGQFIVVAASANCGKTAFVDILPEAVECEKEHSLFQPLEFEFSHFEGEDDVFDDLI